METPPFIAIFSVRWSDLDPNFHVRHSVYYDWCATARIAAMMQKGITPAAMMGWQLGPVLFREECVFKKEVRASDEVTIVTRLKSMRADYGRYSFQQQVMVGTQLCAVVSVDGAWMDTAIRKLAIPPHDMKSMFGELPKTEDFVLVPVSEK